MSITSAIARRGLALTKRADNASDGQDTSFETAMSNLAHVVLQDRAPGLSEYEVGFQLIDRNDDNTRAAAIMAFKIGSTWAYVPIFFIEGRIKGAELLYLKNKDLFVPLKESWVEYLLRQKPEILGNSTPRATGALGVLAPDMRQLVRSPLKYASAQPQWVRDFLPVLAKCVVEDHRQNIPTLPGFLKEAGAPAVKALAHMIRSFPRLAAMCDTLHGAEMASAIKEASAKVPARVVKRASYLLDDMLPKQGALQTITYDDADGSDLPLLLTDEDKSKLLREGPLIEDTRTGEQVSVPYSVNVRQQLQNPTESGLYDVLVRPAAYEKCFVAICPKSTSSHGVFATVVRLDGQKEFANVHPSYVWVGKKYEDPEWSRWYKGLPDADSLTEAKEDDDSDHVYYDGPHFMLLGPNGEATVPFQVRKDLDDGAYQVSFRDYGTPELPAYMAKLPRNDTYDMNRDPYRDPVLHLNGGRGSKLWDAQGDMYVPNGWKKLVVREPDKTPREALQLGTIPEVELDIVRKTAALRVTNDGLTARVNDRMLSTRDAVLHLVCDHGLREKAAREILHHAEAGRKEGRPYFECRVKYASPYLSNNQPGAPAFRDPPMDSEPLLQGSIPSSLPFYQNEVVNDLLPPPNAPQEYNPLITPMYDAPDQAAPPPPDQQAIQTAQSAAQKGQKEVFDTSVINSLLKTTQPDLQVDRYIGNLMKGMDSFGRILISLYWHPDDFAERYGKDDLPELEDMLRNSFLNTGEAILKLKQKAIEADPVEASRQIDMTGLSDN